LDNQLSTEPKSFGIKHKNKPLNHDMKHIITLVAIAFTLSLGACCSTGTCPAGAKKECSTAKKCCGSQACKDKAHKH
jgi:hypothetical protein